MALDKIDNLDRTILNIVMKNARIPSKVGVKLARGSMYREVVKELEKIREVVECHFTTGPYSLLIKVYAKDNQNLMELLNNYIQHIPGVTETETLISLEQSIHRQIDVKVDGPLRTRHNRRQTSTIENTENK